MAGEFRHGRLRWLYRLPWRPCRMPRCPPSPGSKGRADRPIAQWQPDPDGAAAAVLTGARSFAAIAEWPPTPPANPGRARRPPRGPLVGGFLVPTEATIRRTLGRLDAHALAAAVGDWLVARDRHDHRAPAQRPRQRAVAIDGKTLRGAHPPDGHSRPVHLLAAMEHTSRVVLAASGMLAVAAGNPACPGPGGRRALEAGFAACLPARRG
jgi:hypothetical protein